MTGGGISVFFRIFSGWSASAGSPAGGGSPQPHSRVCPHAYAWRLSKNFRTATVRERTGAKALTHSHHIFALKESRLAFVFLDMSREKKHDTCDTLDRLSSTREGVERDLE